MPVGARYCPKCNAIIIYHLCLSPREIEKEIVPILVHETMHWWLCKNINEGASIGFDVINREKDDLEIPHKIPFDFIL
jgi:hypothetical protein